MEFSSIQTSDQDIYNLILNEWKRQSEGMEFIASENYQSAAVLEAQSSVFANKYSEGTPWRRYYWWQENTDKIEQIAIDRAKELFHSDHANVQPLSWAAANICAYNAMMKPGDTIMGMDLSHWGHLTHGNPMTLSSKIYNFVTYKTLPDGTIDYDGLARTAKEVNPRVVLAWFSAYPRELDYAKFAQIAKDVGAYAYADMAHISWFIAAWLLKNPLEYWFNAMMTTTHKSFRWPRWAMILSKWIVSNPLKSPENIMENLPTLIDRSVFPGVQWWPHMQTIAAIAIALKEANSDSFRNYAKQALINSKTMAEEFLKLWYHLVTGWTDNHMIVLDFVHSKVDWLLWFDWTKAENALDHIGISTSKSTIPDDPNPPFRPSWLRIGTPAMTTRGVKENEIIKIVWLMHQAFIHANDIEYLDSLRKDVIDLSKQFPVPSL